MPVVRSLIIGFIMVVSFCSISTAVVAVDQQIAQKPITIKLQDETTIDEAQYTLGAIASIQLSEETKALAPEAQEKYLEMIGKLKALPIGRTPRVGYVDKVRQTEIEAQIEKGYPGLRQQIKWQGPDSVKIRSVGTAYDKDKLIGIATVGLNGWLGGRYSNYTIRPTGEYKDILLPKGDVEVVPRMNEAAELNKRMSVWVDILVNGDRYQSLPIWFSVEVPVTAFVVNGDAKKGNAIIDNYVSKQVIDIAAIGGKAVLDEQELTNKRLKKDIKAGDAITADMIEDIPHVVKDSEVIVEAQVGAVTVKAVAIAVQDGMVGDKVKVRKPDTDIEYEATVIGRNLVSSTEE